MGLVTASVIREIHVPYSNWEPSDAQHLALNIVFLNTLCESAALFAWEWLHLKSQAQQYYLKTF